MAISHDFLIGWPAFLPDLDLSPIAHPWVVYLLRPNVLSISVTRGTFQRSQLGVIDSIPRTPRRTRQGEPDKDTLTTRGEFQCLKSLLVSFFSAEVVLESNSSMVPSKVSAIVTYSTIF